MASRTSGQHGVERTARTSRATGMIQLSRSVPDVMGAAIRTPLPGRPDQGERPHPAVRCGRPSTRSTAAPSFTVASGTDEVDLLPCQYDAIRW
ncbi:hypothetical protein AB0N06_13495 [Streptomyces sp. NPDC051020]|uniref:hypothetical protein n=1 Tax=Streptomyces sp. NPDC051020 TaxID=3155409 RepID=UPI003446E4B0